jgi:DNA-binding MarR family transcriptional regulator
MNRYAKTYSKSAIYNSKFATQEDFIYLINLKAFGAMTKTDLIKKNIQEKPVGMQIISRLIKQGWIEQSDSLEDKRSKIILITPEGIEALEQNMKKIKQATEIVTGDLSYTEKIELIKLLKKLEHFHQPIYAENLDPSQLIDTVYNQYLVHNN